MTAIRADRRPPGAGGTVAGAPGGAGIFRPGQRCGAGPARRPGNSSRPAIGVYIHIPFCVARCRYCDFVSRALGPADPEAYLAALEREIVLAPEEGRSVGTVFLGGGTPSLLSDRQVERLLGAVRSTFEVDADAEITIEANPGTLSAAKAAALRSQGVNRVSLGVQSFDDRLLGRLGRRHTGRQAEEAYLDLRRAGFDNLGVDLIHGLPGQTPALWRRDLARAVGLGPDHLSLYALGVEDGTPLAGDLRSGQLTLPSEEEELEMLALSVELTAAGGYERYEISNFARPGRRCRHNLDCWTLREYRGFGAGAHSFLRSPQPRRTANISDIDAYVRRTADGAGVVSRVEEPPPRQYAGEALMLGLRTSDGIDGDSFSREHGGRPGDLFPEAVALGTVRGWLQTTNGRLRLTGTGILFSNEIFRLLF